MAQKRQKNSHGIEVEFDPESQPYFSSFAADVREDDMWIAEYTSPGAFQASSIVYSSAKSFAGPGVPSVVPNHAGFDVEKGEKYSVFRVPNGFAEKNVPTDKITDLAWDGNYLRLKDSDSIYRIDRDTGALSDKVDVQPFQTTGFTWDGNYYWTASNFSNSVYQIDASTGSGVNDFSTGVESRGLTWTGEYLYIASSGTSYRFQPDGTQKGSFSINSNQVEGASYDGKYLYFAYPAGNEVRVYDESGNFNRSFKKGSNPVGLAWTGSSLWQGDRGNNVVYKVVNSKTSNISYRSSELV